MVRHRQAVGAVRAVISGDRLEADAEGHFDVGAIQVAANLVKVIGHRVERVGDVGQWCPVRDRSATWVVKATSKTARACAVVALVSLLGFRISLTLRHLCRQARQRSPVQVLE